MTLKDFGQQLKIISHRTTSKLYPPNSIESLLYLKKKGISAVEFDVCNTRQGKSVVAHPGFMSEEKIVSSTSFETFVEVCNSNQVEVFIDIKFIDFKFDSSFLDLVKEKIFNSGMDKHSVIISRSKEILIEFKGILPTGCITPKIEAEPFSKWDMLLCPIITIDEDTVLSRLEKQRLVATEVDISNIRLVKELKPYAIMTDYAIEVQELMREELKQ